MYAEGQDTPCASPGRLDRVFLTWQGSLHTALPASADWGALPASVRAAARVGFLCSTELSWSICSVLSDPFSPPPCSLRDLTAGWGLTWAGVSPGPGCCERSG